MGLHRCPLRVPSVRQQEVTGQDHVMARQWLASLLIFSHAPKPHLPAETASGVRRVGGGVCLLKIQCPWVLTSVSVDRQDSTVPGEQRVSSPFPKMGSRGPRGTRCVFSVSPPAAVLIGLRPSW